MLIVKYGNQFKKDYKLYSTFFKIMKKVLSFNKFFHLFILILN